MVSVRKRCKMDKNLEVLLRVHFLKKCFWIGKETLKTLHYKQFIGKGYITNYFNVWSW